MQKIEYKQEVFEFCRNNEYSPGNTYVKYRMSRGGMGKTFAWSNRLRGGKPGDLNAWENSIKNIDKIHERIKDVNFIYSSFDFLHPVLAISLWYLDPPYLPETRVSKQVYENEMGRDEHESMLQKLIQFPVHNHVLISGYDNEMYNDYLNKWNKFTKEIPNHASQLKVKKKKNECIWRNF